LNGKGKGSIDEENSTIGSNNSTTAMVEGKG
jgi:hypothetical protein